MENFDVYNGVAYDSWAFKTNLIPEERYLVSRFLSKDGKTLEAGTAGGRILLELQRLGFANLYGFDYVPRFIAEAQKKSADVHFSVQNAVSLQYPDGSFDQVIYLQQVICFIENKEDRARAVGEALRVLRPGGVALFSFLSLESRSSKFCYRLYMRYLSCLRAVLGRSPNAQGMPWLRLGKGFNWGALWDKSPYVYWFKALEAQELLRKSGFVIEKVATGRQIKMDKLLDDLTDCSAADYDGMLYFVCRKT